MWSSTNVTDATWWCIAQSQYSCYSRLDLTTSSLSRVNCKVLGSKCMSFKNLWTPHLCCVPEFALTSEKKTATLNLFELVDPAPWLDCGRDRSLAWRNLSCILALTLPLCFRFTQMASGTLTFSTSFGNWQRQ